ncbi:uncharacterized protein RJT20DRAFT_136907 [Scheffersomyces xylosifermentans]|uniref:uncharacterized protein n=1 Tax=Scheffersomyces xylosifermentans TaxID=1304137 RepID=UPI00315DC834
MSGQAKEPSSSVQKHRRNNPQAQTARSAVTTVHIQLSGGSTLTPIPLTKAHFLDAYSKGKWNLSKVPCPPCLESTGFMQAPECYNEALRRKSVDEYLKLEHWNVTNIFKKAFSRLRKEFKVTGVSISIVGNSKTYVKVDTSLNVSEIPRGASIDCHTILSQGYFLLLDAKTDWRVSQNPFVAGLPFIKFYCGVPLIASTGEAVGVLSIFDAFAKPSFPEESCKKLQNFAKEIIGVLETPIEQVRSNSKKATDNNSQLNNELNDLTLKLGRATSTKSMLMTVFEKDGSGGPYSQNHTFRFVKLLKNENIASKRAEEKMLWDKLFKIGSIKNAATALANSIAVHYKINLVYIVEIRIAEPYQIQSEFFPADEVKIEAENYRYANKLVKQGKSENEFMNRIIGVSGSPNTQVNLDNNILYHAFTSEFGVEYKNTKDTTLGLQGRPEIETRRLLTFT